MSFTPDEIDRMSPAVKEELQLRELALHQYRKRVPAVERRRSLKKPRQTWPHTWFRHDPDAAYMGEVRKGAKVAAQDGVG